MSQSESTEVQNHSDSSNSKPEEKETDEISKQSFRRKVWDYLEKNKLTNFPRPIYGRIPNFKGSEEAAAKLFDLDEFQNVRYVEVNPDKPQEAVRVLVLERQKNLYVPVPRLKEGLLKFITVSEGATKNDIRNAVSRRGLEHSGQTVSIDDKLQIDLLVIGSVAVSKDGYRIGKGRGYADLEFALLLEMNAISDKTIVVTTVHDSQVFDTLPKEIFKEYDVPVDYILTPTQIIKVEKPLPRPSGIIWNILSQRRLNLMPVLKALKERHEKEGKETILKDVDTDIESFEPRRRFNRIRRFRQRRARSETKNSESQGEENNNENIRPRRFQRKFFRRRKVNRTNGKTNENEDTNNGNPSQNPTSPPSAGAAGSGSTPQKKNSRFAPPYRRNRHIDFSLMVSNIERNVRVRDLKNALIERGIKPNVITWRGYRGICYLHYAKHGAKPALKSSNEQQEPQEQQEPDQEKSPIVIDNVIEILQNLKIGSDSETNLMVKIMDPISRIETTNVTAV